MKVIVSEDDSVTQLLITEKLKSWGYQVVTANSGEETLTAANEHPETQIFIIDWHLPDVEGISIFPQLRTRARNRSIYIIMLTGRKDSDSVIKALNAGADEFITKPFIAEELKARLNVAKRVIQTENKLIHQARHDPLTNVYNHRALVEEVTALWERSKRDNTSLSLLMIDIDFFKKINDAYGHLVGDEALRHFCKITTNTLRRYDIFGRYGGEEFTVCLPSADAEEGVAIAERIRENIANSPLEFDEGSLTMTVSIGVSSFSDDQQSYKQLFACADTAVYDAKRNGRNQVVFRRNLIK